MAISHRADLPESLTRRDRANAWLAAIGLTLVFWQPLWAGGNIAGGDVSLYYYPQKQLLAERLHDGEVPFWNNRTGFGYPTIAESQTGLLYPPTFLLYRLFDFRLAYSLNHLLHYVATFWLMWRFARELDQEQSSALLAALVYTYGWFPPRVHWEWAIIGGVYFPAVLWCAERFLRSGRTIPLGIAAILLATQLLAGHFTLAFINQLCFATYIVLRVNLSGDQLADWIRGHRLRTACLGVATVCVAIVLASPQLIPSWKMNREGTREQTTEVGFDPGFGNIPPIYLTQLAASWWYWDRPSVDRDAALDHMIKAAHASATNQVEAHLYFGLVPLILIAVGIAIPRWRERFVDGTSLMWLSVGSVAVIYTTGWLVPLTRYLPGFSLFRGPARFGIVATFAAAVLAGRALTVVCARLSRSRRSLIEAIVWSVTVVDLLAVGRVVTYATAERETAFSRIERSPIRDLLQQAAQPVRLLAPWPNTANLLGVSSLPIYLGFGPREYSSDPRFKSPPPAVPNAEFMDWAVRSGITHVLAVSELPSGEREPRLREVFRGVDPFLHLALSRPNDVPLFLYELTRASGRCVLEDPDAGTVHISAYRANRVELKADVSRATTVVLRDLFASGWSVSVDGQRADPKRIDHLFRGVDVAAGHHVVVWTFRAW